MYPEDLNPPRWELSNGGLGIGVVLTVCWQIVFVCLYWGSNPAVHNLTRDIIFCYVLCDKNETKECQIIDVFMQKGGNTKLKSRSWNSQ